MRSASHPRSSFSTNTPYSQPVTPLEGYHRTVHPPIIRVANIPHLPITSDVQLAGRDLPARGIRKAQRRGVKDSSWSGRSGKTSFVDHLKVI